MEVCVGFIGMKNFISFLFFLSIVTFNSEASELQLRCKTGLFSSSEIVQRGSSIFLDGKKYPEKTERINSRGYSWATIRQVNKEQNKLVLEQFSKNINNGFIPEIEYFIIDLKDLSFIQGVEINKKRISLAELVGQWFGRSSGTCKVL